MTYSTKKSSLFVAPILLSIHVITRQIFSFPSSQQDVGIKSEGGEIKMRAAPFLILPQHDNKKVEELGVWEIAPKKTHLSEVETASSSIVCACAKCGSTSFFQTIYEITHGKKWKYENRPWVQTIDASRRWTDIRARRIYSEEANENSKRFKSIALIRDPKERIISSWKSKIRCKTSNSAGARRFVPHVLQLAGFSNNLTKTYIDKNGIESPCLDLSIFLQAMFQIHSQGKDGTVDSHFRPQHLGCFYRFPPKDWTAVTTAGDPNLVCRLKTIIFGTSNNETSCEDGAMKRIHTTESLEQYANLTELDEAILDAITKEEYEALGPYLT